MKDWPEYRRWTFPNGIAIIGLKATGLIEIDVTYENLSAIGSHRYGLGIFTLIKVLPISN